MTPSAIDLDQFKPFTLEEVTRVTGCDVKFLDKVTNTVDGFLKLQQGQGVYGLDFLQTFEVFVAWRYIEQGGGMPRALWAMRVVAALSLQGLDREHAKDRTFIVGQELGRAMLVQAPRNKIGRALCTKRLMREFRARLERVFPSKGK
jgi:hypothetical protein